MPIRLRFSRLRLSVCIATGLVLVFYNAAVAFQVFRDYRSGLDHAAVEATYAARLTAEQVGHHLTMLVASLDSIDMIVTSHSPVLHDQHSKEIVRMLMAAMAARLDMICGFILIDERGHAVMDERTIFEAPPNLSDRDYFKAHLDARDEPLFIGEPIVARTSGEWVVGVSRGRKDEDGTFLGVVAAVVEPVFLGRLLAAMDLGRGSVAAFVTQNGTIFARSIAQDTMMGRRAADDAELRDDPSAGWPWSPNKLVRSEPVPGFPMSVVVSLDRREVLLSWRDKLPLYGLAMLLPSAVILASVALVRRRQTALEVSEASLRMYVTKLNDTRLRLEDQAITLATLAGQNASARERAEAASMAKTLFLANMSHELRTPLNAIIGFAEMIERQDLGPVGNPQYAEYGSDIHASGRHLLDLINDILDISRIEADKYVLEPEMVSLVEVVRSCCRLVYGRAKDAGVAVVNEIGEFPSIEADERAVRQVLINLLTNAVKFTPAGGRVTVSAAAGGSEFVVRVADTGIGIKAEDIPKLGQPFEQANNQLCDKPAGTGLGLALSRRLVELHGGRLSIESEVGVGTTVTFTLPLEHKPFSRETSPRSSRSSAIAHQNELLQHVDAS